MQRTTLQSRSIRFSHKGLVWLMLIVFCLSFAPSISLAQQPTATISDLSGTVLVNGQAAGKGTILSAGDVIETQAGASLVLELSDGSQLDIGENTRLDLAELSQTATGARVSKVKVAWGWLRAKLSPGHQQEGSAFDIETPNALVGVKFSQPDVEVSYNPESQETVALAHTVSLAVVNLITNERIIVPVGSSAIITMIGIQVVAGLVETGAVATAAETAGMGTGTKVAIGAGVIAAAGGVAILVAGDGGGSGGGQFAGTWVYDDGYDQETLHLSQNGTSLSGDYTFTLEYASDCPERKWGDLTGNVQDGRATVIFQNGTAQWCDGDPFSYNPDPLTCDRRDDDGSYLYCDGWKRYDRR